MILALSQCVGKNGPKMIFLKKIGAAKIICLQRWEDVVKKSYRR
jgi:hypothetical protein